MDSQIIYVLRKGNDGVTVPVKLQGRFDDNGVFTTDAGIKVTPPAPWTDLLFGDIAHADLLPSGELVTRAPIKVSADSLLDPNIVSRVLSEEGTLDADITDFKTLLQKIEAIQRGGGAISDDVLAEIKTVQQKLTHPESSPPAPPSGPVRAVTVNVPAVSQASSLKKKMLNVSAPGKKPIRVQAFVDGGALTCLVDPDLIKELGVPYSGIIDVVNIDGGHSLRNTARFTVHLGRGVLANIEAAEHPDLFKNTGCRLLAGRPLIEEAKKQKVPLE